MIDVRLTASQRRHVSSRLRATDDASYGRRLLAILALDEGEPVSEVAERLGVARQTVYNWARAFEGVWSRVVFGDFSGGGLFLDAVLEDGPLDDFYQERRTVQRSPTL